MKANLTTISCRIQQETEQAFKGAIANMMQNINIWLRDKSPNWHLAMLITLQLQLNWEGRINLVTVTDERRDEKRLYNFLEMLSDLARLPSMTDFYVLTGPFKQQIKSAPRADINIFGLAQDIIPYNFIREVPELTRSSCIFVKDSGKESA